jgi:hypothetical protein
MTTKGSFCVEIYKCCVNITICDDILKSINYYLKKWDNKLLAEEPLAYFMSGVGEDESHYYLFFNRDHINSNILNHEKSHLIDHILKERGIKAHDEARAYLDGYISEKINSFFKRRKIKIR